MPTSAAKRESILRRHWAATLRVAQRGDTEEALLQILRLPDKLAGHKDARELDYRLLGHYLATLKLTDPLERAVAGLLEGICLYRAGDTPAALERFTGARHDAGEIADEQRSGLLQAAATCGEAVAAMRAGDRKAAIRRARAAVAAAEAAQAQWLKAFAQHTLGRVLSVDPRHRTRARALLEAARSGYRAPGINDLRGEAYTLQVLGRLRADDGDTEEGLVLLHKALTLMRRSHADRGAATLLIEIGWLRSYQQSHSLARSYGRQALDIFDNCNDYRGEAKAYHLIGWTQLREGRADEAQAAFERAEELAATTDCASLKATCSYYCARCAFERGQDQECKRRLGSITKAQAADPLTDAATSALEAAFAVRRHQWQRAAALIRRLLGRLRAVGVPRIEADGLFLCGFELCREGRHEQAAPLVRRALEVAEPGQAAGAFQTFFSVSKGVGVEQWLAALASAVGRETAVTQQLTDQTDAAIFGLHDLKNKLMSIASQIEIHQASPEECPLAAIKADAEATTVFALELMAAFSEGESILKPRMEPFDMAAWVLDQADIGNRFPSGGLTYEADIEPDLPLVMADERAMALIIGNFKSNAERYAPNLTITLSAKARRNKQGKIVGVIFGFADTGPGMHKEDLEIIFGIGKDPSQYKVKGKNHGSGVGLGYCRVLVEGHGGHIWAESELGKGATFYVELPVPKSPVAESAGE